MQRVARVAELVVLCDIAIVMISLLPVSEFVSIILYTR